MKRNCSIDLCRLLCAVLVVAIHTKPPADVGGQLGYFGANILPRPAVPFFFAVSGYFFIQKLERGEKNILGDILKVCGVYFVWSCIYWLFDFARWGYLDIKGFIKTCVLPFFVSGSMYHFWYFPALIISMILASAFYKLKIGKALLPVSILCYALGCLLGVYYHIVKGIPIFLLHFGEPVL